MKKRHFNKLLIVFVGVIFTLPCIVMFSSVYTISDSYAQEKTATGGADKIKAALLRPDGWIAQWRCNLGPSEADFVFEARGENVMVKMHNIAMNQTCERNVTITSDVVKMDGCNEAAANTTLTFDPNDHEYPFKGGNKNCNLKLRAK
jgi:hypothetical protein